MDYSFIGKIAGTHGLDGKVILRHHLNDSKKLMQLAHIFIELNKESYIPFFIEEKKKLNEDEVLFRLDEVQQMEQAKALSGKSVYIEKELYQKLHPKAVHEGMEGFTILDKKAGNIGTIISLMETPGQVLASVKYQGKEALIPLIDATIIGIDPLRKIIEVQLPDGLLDIYTA